MQDYYVTLPYASYLLTATETGVIVEAPPIAEWMIGKNIQYVTKWVTKKKGQTLCVTKT